ncbi:MAG: T9SS type A sorting domain-containing protein, partial [candidate division WOR-3 bacterium]
KNHSVNAKTFNITFKVSNNYTNTRSKTIASNAQDTVNFSLWTGSRGPYTTRCSLYLANDVYRRNDTLSGSFTLQVHDVGVVSIVQPTDSVDRGDLQPKATIRNYGSVPEAFYTFFKIYNSTGSLVYLDSVYINNLNPSAQTTRTFRSFIFQVGSYQVRCSTALANDANPSNNVKFKTIYVRYTPPWVRKRDVPVGPSSKPVSYGGALVAGDGKVYLLKGNNTREFFVYNPDTDSWTLLESIPFISDSSRKKVNKGAVLAYNNHANPDVIYATKGNNTLEFWMYDTENDTWIPKAPVPVSYPVKKVKGGAALVYLKRGNNQYVYLLKGNNTNEFYCYHCQADTWITNLRRPPLGPYLKAYKDGSCMTVGYNNYLYLLKGGATINEFYAYVPSGDSWITLETLPRYSRLLNKATKVKDGAAICYDGDSLLYVIKGGGKQDFWCYNAIRHTWKELDTIPKAPSNKAPKSGSALAFLDDKIYLIKGNRTYEFWRYIPGISDVPLAYPMVVPNLTIEQPSKLDHTGKVHAITDWSNRNLLLRLSLDQTSQVQVNLYNSAGQLVRKVLHTELGRGNYELAIAKAELSAGVYLVKCQINGTTYQYKWTLR